MPSVRMLGVLVVLSLFIVTILAAAPFKNQVEASEPAVPSTQNTLKFPTLQVRLNNLNFLAFDRTYGQWLSGYVGFRQSNYYAWMDWSSDYCSDPTGTLAADALLEEALTPSCVRHDFLWRSLAVADQATGRFWNERNRRAADDRLDSDLAAACTSTYRPAGLSRAFCVPAANTLHLFATKYAGYRRSLTQSEETSLEANHRFKLLHPGGHVRLNYVYQTLQPSSDCSQTAATYNRCLPIYYMTYNGAPFSPQKYFAPNASFMRVPPRQPMYQPAERVRSAQGEQGALEELAGD